MCYEVIPYRDSIASRFHDDGFGNLISTWPGFVGKMPDAFYQMRLFCIDAVGCDTFYLNNGEFPWL